MSDRSHLPEIGPVKPMMRQKCGTCANWIVGDHQAERETMRHPKRGHCLILDCGTFYHAGGMCPHSDQPSFYLEVPA